MYPSDWLTLDFTGVISSVDGKFHIKDQNLPRLHRTLEYQHTVGVQQGTSLLPSSLFFLD